LAGDRAPGIFLPRNVWHSLAPHDYRKTRCISSLMARLRPNIAPERIDSLHGFGFRFRVEVRDREPPIDDPTGGSGVAPPRRASTR
jgi:hypothetical protein